MFNKILILSASSGAGHIRAAQAIEKAALEKNVAGEVRHVDTLEYANRAFRNMYSRMYIDMVNHMPEVMGLLYDRFDRPWEGEKRRLAFDRLNTRPFVKLLNEYKPDMTVCTHFLPAEIISWLKARKLLDCPQAIVVTDLDVHSMWLCHYYEHYFVALDETRAHLERLGIVHDRISVSGIPIDPEFTRLPDSSTARKALELPEDRPCILLSTGGFGVGPVNDILQELLQLRNAAQIVVLCGRNAELKQKLERAAKLITPNYHVKVRVVGFTDRIQDYMAAADMIVGKPGGLTTSESLAAGLVMVIVNPIPGQEERNSDHLLEEGVAIRCNNLPTLAFKIDRLLDDKERFAAMKQNAIRLGKPQAAYKIVDELMRLRPLASVRSGARKP